MALHFRLAENPDRATLLALMRELYAYDKTPFDAEEHGHALETLLAHESYGRIWIIQQGKEAIGYVVLAFGYSLEFRGRDAIIDELFIAEKYRRQGIGTRVLEFLEETCRTLDVRAMHLEVECANIAAQGFYRKKWLH